MKSKFPLPAALVVGATMVATVVVGVILLRDEPSAPPPSPSRPVDPPTPPAAAPVPPPTPPEPKPTPPAPAPAPSGGGPSVATTPPGLRPCKVARDGDGPVADACRRGGQDAAKRFMKDMVNRTKGRPDRVTCDTCHENVDDFTLQEDARTKLADLLASLGGRPATIAP